MYFIYYAFISCSVFGKYTKHTDPEEVKVSTTRKNSFCVIQTPKDIAESKRLCQISEIGISLTSILQWNDQYVQIYKKLSYHAIYNMNYTEVLFFNRSECNQSCDFIKFKDAAALFKKIFHDDAILWYKSNTIDKLKKFYEKIDKNSDLNKFKNYQKYKTMSGFLNLYISYIKEVSSLCNSIIELSQDLMDGPDKFKYFNTLSFLEGFSYQVVPPQQVISDLERCRTIFSDLLGEYKHVETPKRWISLQSLRSWNGNN